MWKAKDLGLCGTHPRPNGFRTEPDWEAWQVEMLRRDYGHVPSRELAVALGRKLRAMYIKAYALGLKTGRHADFTEEERQAMRNGWGHGVSLTDVSEALGRQVSVVSKHAIRMGIPYARQPIPAPRGKRADRPVQARVTLRTLLALPSVPASEAEACAARRGRGRPKAECDAETGGIRQ